MPHVPPCAIASSSFAPALLVIAVARERRDIDVLTISLAVTAGAITVVALAEWYFDRHWIPLFPGVIFDTLERADHLRARATFPHPIVLGTFLAMSLQLTSDEIDDLSFAGVAEVVVRRGSSRAPC